MEGTDLGSCMKASVVPAGLSSYFLGLPRTCVRGCTMPPLRGWGLVAHFVSLSLRSVMARLKPRSFIVDGLSQRWKRCATQNPRVEAFVGQECPTHTAYLWFRGAHLDGA
jgi:hypothetical protein